MTEYRVVLDGVPTFAVEIISSDGSRSLRGFPTEAARVEFRADLFNAFNHTQWGNATNTTLPSNVNAGRITSTRPPRQMQFSLSFHF